jgi:hypothetical protein
MLAPIHAKTLRIDEAQSVMPVLVDIPDNWIKNQILKDNGIIYTLRLENAEIEIRSFIFNGVDMDYIIHAKAARMYAKYSYINILLEKEETLGDVKKQTIFWKIRHQNKTYYEKTVILQYINNIVILSCLAPEDEYPHHRVIFENAILSIKYDIENGEATTVSDKDKKKEGSTEKKEITKEILRDIEEKYSRENKINKMDKLKKENEEK